MSAQNLEIYIRLERQYGRDRLFPACPISEAICKIAERKTLRQKHLKELSDAGFKIYWSEEPQEDKGSERGTQ